MHNDLLENSYTTGLADTVSSIHLLGYPVQEVLLEVSQLRDRVTAQDRELEALRDEMRQKEDELREKAAAIELLEERSAL